MPSHHTRCQTPRCRARGQTPAPPPPPLRRGALRHPHRRRRPLLACDQRGEETGERASTAVAAQQQQPAKPSICTWCREPAAAARNSTVALPLRCAVCLCLLVSQHSVRLCRARQGRQMVWVGASKRVRHARGRLCQDAGNACGRRVAWLACWATCCGDPYRLPHLRCTSLNGSWTQSC